MLQVLSEISWQCQRTSIKMMTISESNYSSKNMSTVHTLNNKVVHQDSFNDVQQSSSTNSSLITNRGFKPSDMFDPQKKEFLTNLSYKLFPVSWVSWQVSIFFTVSKANDDQLLWPQLCIITSLFRSLIFFDQRKLQHNFNIIY